MTDTKDGGLLTEAGMARLREDTWREWCETKHPGVMEALASGRATIVNSGNLGFLWFGPDDALVCISWRFLGYASNERDAIRALAGGYWPEVLEYGSIRLKLEAEGDSRDAYYRRVEAN